MLHREEGEASPLAKLLADRRTRYDSWVIQLMLLRQAASEAPLSHFLNSISILLFTSLSLLFHQLPLLYNFQHYLFKHSSISAGQIFRPFILHFANFRCVAFFSLCKVGLIMIFFFNLEIIERNNSSYQFVRTYQGKELCLAKVKRQLNITQRNDSFEFRDAVLKIMVICTLCSWINGLQ